MKNKKESDFTMNNFNDGLVSKGSELTILSTMFIAKERYYAFRTIISHLLYKSDLDKRATNIVLELIEHSLDESMSKDDLGEYENWLGDKKYQDNYSFSVTEYGIYLFNSKYRTLHKAGKDFMFPAFIGNLIILPLLNKTDKEAVLDLINQAGKHVMEADRAVVKALYEYEMKQNEDDLLD